jgi:protein SCO1/2
MKAALAAALLMFTSLPASHAAKTDDRVQLPFFAQDDFTPVWRDDASVARVRKFTLIDQDRRRVDLARLRGHSSVVNFFFASCDGICPMMMARMKTLQSRLRGVKGLRMFSFSVTPKTDSPRALRDYAKENHIDLRNWSLVTGDRSELYRMARRDFQADKKTGQEQVTDSFLHSENVFLIDAEFRIRGIYNSKDPGSLALLAKDAASLGHR